MTDRVVAEQDDPAMRYELAELLQRLKNSAADDERTVPAWDRIRKAAPKAWEASKVLRDSIISEAVKRGLDALMA